MIKCVGPASRELIWGGRIVIGSQGTSPGPLTLPWQPRISVLRMSGLKDHPHSPPRHLHGRQVGYYMVYCVPASFIYCLPPGSAREPAPPELYPQEGPSQQWNATCRAVFEGPCSLHSHVPYVCVVFQVEMKLSPFVAFFNSRSTSVAELRVIEFCRKFSSKVSAQHPAARESAGCKTPFQAWLSGLLYSSCCYPDGSHPSHFVPLLFFPFLLG